MDLFKGTSKKAFSLSDLTLLTGEKRSSISVQLSRLVRSGLVSHPVRGWYLNPFRPPSNEELAMVLRNPSYLSMEYALSRHGVLSQSVFAYTLITTKLPYTFHTDGDVFEYHQVKRSLFRGYVREETVLVAEPEKAIADLLYIRCARSGRMKEDLLRSLLDDMDLSEIDMGKLYEYSEEFGGRTNDIISKLAVG